MGKTGENRVIRMRRLQQHHAAAPTKLNVIEQLAARTCEADRHCGCARRQDTTSVRTSTMAAVAGTSSNTFFTSPVKGSGLRGIELDRAYQGETLNGKRHGYGVYTYPGGFFRYEGQYVNGQKHGKRSPGPGGLLLSCAARGVVGSWHVVTRT